MIGDSQYLGQSTSIAMLLSCSFLTDIHCKMNTTAAAAAAATAAAAAAAACTTNS